MAQSRVTTKRLRKTGLRVKVAEWVSRIAITTAGIGTILAVALVCLFLVWVVIPLFLPGSVRESHRLPAVGGSAPLHVVVDEHEIVAWAYFPDSTVKAFRLDTGEVFNTSQLFAENLPTAQAFALQAGDAVFGFEAGRVRLGRIHFTSTFLEPLEVAADHRALPIGGVAQDQGGVVQRTPAGQFRLQRLEVELEEPLQLQSASSVALLDVSMQSYGPVVAALTEDGMFHIHGIRTVRNLMTRQETQVLSGGNIPLPLAPQEGLPQHLLLEGRADSAVLAWQDGYTIRLDTRDRTAPAFAEALDLVEGDGIQLTSLDFLIGKTTFVAGDSLGRLSTWFRIKPEYRADERPLTSDASLLVKQHTLPGPSAGVPVTCLAASSRTRMLLAGLADGRVRLYHVTSGQLLAESQVLEPETPVAALTFSPKDNGLLAGSQQSLSHWVVDMPHPQTTLASIFAPVWYEGFEEPEHVWQSSGGSDEFEPKYGLVPLVFGTFKATFYTMLFGVPIALLAAVFTSELLHKKLRSAIKPVIEMMASLPSVVLGFMAALVFAPLVEQVVPAVLLSFFFVPLVLLTAAFVWQLLPSRLATVVVPYRFAFIVLALPAALGLSWSAGPLVEDILFAGDLRGWLAWSFDPAEPEAGLRFRGSIGGWTVLLLPLGALAATVLVTTLVNPRLDQLGGRVSRTRLALLNLVKFGIGVVLAGSLAVVLASLFSGLGLDPRGTREIGGLDLSPLGIYMQRNALIVGFVMGFAVIPIIYTLADDALSSVPEHLRAASLGAGATPWQTAVRIIIPTAMSGIFSAVMVGLGRAVGETMIVLMATGNTPLMEMNFFNGFRTLSANIAVELPEAVQNGTNYRMLFLAALTLFAMTFVINTVAELVRLRFRKRAFQL